MPRILFENEKGKSEKYCVIPTGLPWSRLILSGVAHNSVLLSVHSSGIIINRLATQKSGKCASSIHLYILFYRHPPLVRIVFWYCCFVERNTILSLSDFLFLYLLYDMTSTQRATPDPESALDTSNAGEAKENINRVCFARIHASKKCT